MKKENISIRLFLMVFVVASLATFNSCRTTTPAVLPKAQSFSVQQEEALQADTTGGFVRMPDTRVMVRSLHSDDSLWIEVRTSDTLSLRSMLINGLSIFIDPEAGKSTKFGVNFPAARSEMLKRQEEIMKQASSENDSVPPQIKFDTAYWVDIMKTRQAVITDTLGTRFADKETATLSLNHRGELVYLVRFEFARLGISGEDQQRISIGIVAELHQAQLASSGGGGMATRPNITERERQQRQSRAVRAPRMMLIPVNAWMAFLINEEMTEDPSRQESSEDSDDVYFTN